jgi:hypothetical protein
MKVLVHGSPKRYGTRGDARGTDPTTINQQNKTIHINKQPKSIKQWMGDAHPSKSSK